MTGYAPVVDKLCHRWETKRPETAIIRAVTSTFRDFDRFSVPINLNHLALRRKITRVLPSPLRVDGLISSMDGETYVVQVNEDHPAARQRFTCAHEIGHTFFFELEPNRPRTGFRLEDDGLQNLPRSRSEEYLCNVAAAEILMPYPQFFDRMDRFGLGASAVVALAKDFNVSLQAAALRLTSLSLHKIVVVLWGKASSGSSYHSLWQTGRVVSTSASRVCVRSNDPMFELLECRKKFSERSWASLGGPLDNYFVDGLHLASRTAERVLTVFILEKSAETLVLRGGVRARQSSQLDLF